MIITWLAGIVGPRLARPVLIVGAVLLLLSVLGVGKCVYDRGERAQARQTERSSEAIADAAENAVAVITNRTDADRGIDAIVSEAAKDIENAPNAAVAHHAALSAVCQLPEYRKDPACTVR